jgi:hypothetical protein
MNCPSCNGKRHVPCRLCYATGNLDALYWAFTRDGEACNECGGRVGYVAEMGLHAHSEPAPECPAAQRIAAANAKADDPRHGPRR